MRRMRLPGLLACALAAATGFAQAQETTPTVAPDGGRVTAPDAERVDQGRFSQRPADAAYGAYQRGYYITALNIATPLAINGDPAAQTLIAELYSRGMGVRQDMATATEWYEKAAAQNVPEAMFQLAMILLDGGPEFRDRNRAFEVMGRAADAGNSMAQFNYAQMILAREQTPEALTRAFSYYEQAADRGLPDAQYAMAQALQHGVAGREVDMPGARRWLELAAAQNFDTAQIDLGAWLIDGIGGDRDLEAGFGWTMRAAAAGNPAAQNRVAKLYRAGIGVEPDSIAAAAWYLRARRVGLVDPLMEDHLAGLTEDQLKQAGEQAGALG
ncbi:tetratricopeptide repeat protein [Mesorhizobium sp. CAU 1732]|uniref:tetratricopeptide repeat protein n=1 Tax=Mesorhizobium sp. CAU 1732 TaxID=3140358 RepID=UPI003260C431